MNTLTLSAADAKLLGQHISGTKSIGPLTLTYHIDLSIPQIAAHATLYNIPIGSILINPQHPSARIGGDTGIAKAEIVLTADFASRSVGYNIDAEILDNVIYTGQGTLFSW